MDARGRSRLVKETTSTLAVELPEETTVDVGAVHELDLEQTSEVDGGKAERQVKSFATTVSPVLDWHVTVRVRVPEVEEHEAAFSHADHGLESQK